MESNRIDARFVEAMNSLLGAASLEKPWWRDDELGQILRHQLDARLSIAFVQPLSIALTTSESTGKSSQEMSFADLLFGEKSDIDMLKVAKEFAKSADSRADDPLPPSVATVMYYAAIVACQLRHHENISELSGDQVERGAEWVLQQKWIDERVRNLFTSWLTTQ